MSSGPGLMGRQNSASSVDNSKSETPSSISILDKLCLKKNAASGKQQLSQQNSRTPSPVGIPSIGTSNFNGSTGSKLSKLAALRAAKGKSTLLSSETKSTLAVGDTKPYNESSKSSLLEKIRARKAEAKSSSSMGVAKLQPSQPQTRQTTPSPETFAKNNEEIESLFSGFQTKSTLLSKATSLMSAFAVKAEEDSLIVDKLRNYDAFLQGIYLPVTRVLTNNRILVANNSKIKENFSGKSPDDKVLEAQNSTVNKKDAKDKDVENVASGLNNLNIKPKTTKPKKTIDIKKIVSELDSHGEHKPNLSFAVIGHVDAGKSTLMGMFLKSLDKVDKKFLKKLEDESAKSGKKSFALAWIMDQTTEERSRGVTVDICTTSVSTDKANFIIIDAPGHKDYVPRMINGVSQADIGLLIIDSNYDGFESGFSYDGQTKEHALLSYCLGLRKLVIVLNKLDVVDYDESRFNDIKSRLQEYLVKDVGFEASQLVFVPVSGIDGTNVVTRPSNSKLASWYPKSEPTLLGVLENEARQLNVETQADNKSILDEKFSFQIADVNLDYHQSSEFALVGRVNSGIIQPGETISVSPAGVYLQIDSIRTSESVSGKEIEVYKERDYAIKYDNNISLIFKDKKAKEEIKANVDLIKPGDLVSNVDQLIPPTTKFECELKLFDLREHPLLPGAKVLLHSGGNERPAEITKFISMLDTKKKKKRILHLGSYKSAVVEVELIDESAKSPRPLPLLTYDSNNRLGRVVFRRDGITIGEGKILKIV